MVEKKIKDPGYSNYHVNTVRSKIKKKLNGSYHNVKAPGVITEEDKHCDRLRTPSTPRRA